MKQISNNFAVTGFVGADAQVRNFENTSVARFSIAVSRSEKNGDATVYTSAFLSVEAWRKNSNLSQFDLLKKGTQLTIEGYFKPEEWTDADGTKHNRIILTATKIAVPEDKIEEPEPAPEPQKTTKKKGK